MVTKIIFPLVLQVDGSTYGASAERPYRPYPRVVSRVGGGWEWAERLQSSGGLHADTAFFGDETTATEMQRQLNVKLGKGAVGVSRSESPGGYSWTVTFIRHSGDVPLMEVSSHPAAGSVTVDEAVKGEITHFHGGQGELAMRVAHHRYFIRNKEGIIAFSKVLYPSPTVWCG